MGLGNIQGGTIHFPQVKVVVWHLSSTTRGAFIYSQGKYVGQGATQKLAPQSGAYQKICPAMDGGLLNVFSILCEKGTHRMFDVVQWRCENI